jgi:hypothetical protein
MLLTRQRKPGKRSGLLFLAVVVLAATACSSSDPTSPTLMAVSYSGPFSGQMIITTDTASPGRATTTCQITVALGGTLKIIVAPAGDKDTTHAEMSGAQTETSRTAGTLCAGAPLTGSVAWNVPASGTTSLAFSGQTITTLADATVSTEGISFTGSLSGGVITGTMILTHATSGTSQTPGSTVKGNGTATFAVTLR